MPVTSKAQYRFMKAAEEGKEKGAQGGRQVPTRKQAKEFTKGQSPKDLPEKVKKK